jgi:hypothetical protein
MTATTSAQISFDGTEIKTYFNVFIRVTGKKRSVVNITIKFFNPEKTGLPITA